jgi:hypothetical protein
MKMEKINEFTTLIVCTVIVALAAIVGIVWFNIHERSLMAENMNAAISKGIDPLSVRCSYVQSHDLICVAFAASAQSHNVAGQVKK